MRVLCVSRTYGLSSTPAESNVKDIKVSPGGIRAGCRQEVLLDAIACVPGVPTVFAGLPARHPGH